MSIIRRGAAFQHGPDVENNAPSSGDGAECESKYNPNTGCEIPGYVAPMPSARMDTSGANSGLGHSESGAADARAYVETRAASEGILEDAGAAGFALPTDLDKFHTSNEL